MTIVEYDLLPRPARRQAQKLAKKLLRDVPAAESPPIFTSPRAALSTAFIKPENVIAALVYGDGDGNWWCDAVLRKGNDTVQLGTNDKKPLKSAEDAMEAMRAVIATIKAMRESPFVQGIRDLGFDPLQVQFLCIQSKENGCRWLPMDETQTEARANAFAIFAEALNNHSVDALELARSIILHEAPKYVTETDILLPNEWSHETEKAYSFLLNAAAFASANGVLNVEGVGAAGVTDFLAHGSTPTAEAAQALGVPVSRLDQLKAEFGIDCQCRKDQQRLDFGYKPIAKELAHNVQHQLHQSNDFTNSAAKPKTLMTHSAS